MRTIIAWTAALMAVSALCFAAVPPQTINYQGYLKDGAGVPVNSPVNLTFRLYSSTSGVNPLWSGAPQSVTPQNGIYSTTIGPTSLPFDRQYYLGVDVGGTELTPLQKLEAAPYALRASNADSAATSTTLNGQSLSQLDSRYISPTEPKATPQQIATLRWDQVNIGGSSYSVGTNPLALVFDGNNLWIANNNSNNITKINPASGAALGTYPVGNNPIALAFDGSNVWVANYSSNNIQKINPSSGAVLGTYSVGTRPYALAFDGTSIWVANFGSNNVQKINPANGAVLGTYAVGISPLALAFDGSSIWVANYGDNSLSKLDPSSGNVLGSYPVGSNPMALAFDGSSIWVTNNNGGNIMKINPATGGQQGTYAVGSNPQALAYDGGSIWVANFASDTVTKINPVNGTVIATFTITGGPRAVAFDGSSIWVASYSSNSVSRILHAGLVVGPATVGTSQLTDNSVTTAKLANGAVTDTKISGTISAAKGGTGLNTSATAAGSLLRTTGTGTWGTLPAGGNGQVLKIAAGTPVWGTDDTGSGTVTSISAGTGIAVTPSPITTTGSVAIDTAVVPRLGASNTFSQDQILINSNPAKIPLTIIGAPSQSSNLQEWKNNGGTTVASVSPTGVISGDGSGLSGVQKKYAKVAVVAQSGGDYTSPVTALSNVATWCGTPSVNNPCLLKIMPGVYDLGSGTLTMQQYVDIEGSGELSTTITSTITGESNGTVRGASNAELRFLTVKNTAPFTFSVWGVGIANAGSSPRISHVTVTTSVASNSCGIYNASSAAPVISNATVSAVGVNNSYGIVNASAANPTLVNVTTSASGTGSNYGIHNSGGVARLVNVIATGTGGSNNIGMSNGASSGTYTVVIDRSTVEGSTNSISTTYPGYTLKIGASKLIGPVSPTGTYTYFASYSDTTTLDSATIGTQTFQTGAVANKGLVLKGAAGQSANLQEWQDSTGTLLAWVSSGGIFSGDGSGLTNLNASSLASGAIGDARLSANVALLNTPQTFSGAKSFSAPVTSTVAAGTAPLTVASSTMVSNFNAEMVGGQTLAGLDSRYAAASTVPPPAQAPKATTFTNVDTGGAGIVGQYTSITIGTDGLPVIAYNDNTNTALKVAKCANTACTASTITTIDNTASVGQYTSIAVGTDGLPVISYSDSTNTALKVAKCANTSCTASTITTIDNTAVVGQYTSIAVGTDGLPVITYYDTTNGDLKMAKCTNTSCTASTITTVDTGGAGIVGQYTSIAIGADGLPVISYYDVTNGDLKVARCTTAACSVFTLMSPDTTGNIGQHTSIAVGADGLPVISYIDVTNSNLKVIKCASSICFSGNTITTVDDTGTVGLYNTSITIGTDGLPVISYYDNTNGYLKAAKCANTACTGSATVTTVDSAVMVGAYSSITIGADGLPVISYYDGANGNLKVAKCSNQFCLNNWSRR